MFDRVINTSLMFTSQRFWTEIFCLTRGHTTPMTFLNYRLILDRYLGLWRATSNKCRWSFWIFYRLRSSHWRCSVKKVFLEISQNSQKNTQACNFVKKRDSGACGFLWILRNFLQKTFSYRTLFPTEHLRWLFLQFINQIFYLLTITWCSFINFLKNAT